MIVGSPAVAWFVLFQREEPVSIEPAPLAGRIAGAGLVAIALARLIVALAPLVGALGDAALVRLERRGSRARRAGLLPRPPVVAVDARLLRQGLLVAVVAGAIAGIVTRLAVRRRASAG